MEEVGGNPKLRMNKDSLSYYQDVFLTWHQVTIQLP